ncbi:MAG: invasion associated locus B family protein [Alphaproteobacteria bacterium]|nr:invasion associated locus B family protein [Alphaproteobacteria bacterium]
MSTHFSRSCAMALAGALLLIGGAAWAQQAPAAGAAQQQQQPQGPIAADLVAVQPDWTKVCGSDPQTKKELCYTTRDFGVSAKEGEAPQPLLALAIYDPKADDQKIIRLLLPPGLLLKPGFRFAIDKGTPESGAFEICYPNGCFAEAKVKKAVVDSMKKAEKMSVVVKNQANNEVTFYLPLANFGKAFDGPAIDPKVLEEQQKRLQDELQKKAEEERKRLEAQKGAAPAAPSAAPKK